MTDIHSLAVDAKMFLETHQDWERVTREEMEFLRARNFKSAEAIMKIKRGVVERYQSQLKHLFDHRELLLGFPIALKETLKESQLAFDRISAEYTRELELALDSTMRLVELVRSAIKEQVNTSQFYGKSGAMQKGADPRASTVNRSA